jgi:hypothetical protein
MQLTGDHCEEGNDTVVDCFHDDYRTVWQKAQQGRYI